jgi:hypothetical protein
VRDEKDFLDELERRLEENRVVAARHYLPKWLEPVASVVGFEAGKILLLTSFLLTLLLFVSAQDQLFWLSKKMLGL